MTAITKNSKTLDREIRWFTQVLDTRLKLYFKNDCGYQDIHELETPVLKKNESAYADFVHENYLDREERIALLLALVPHLKPELLDVFFTRNASYDKGFSEFGGIRGKNFNGFLPTGETLLFVLAGNDLKKRMQADHYLLNTSILFRNGILKLSGADAEEPMMSGILSINVEYLSYFTTGVFTKPDYSPNFPAKLITTPLEWQDLVLDNYVMQEVEEIKTWIEWNSGLHENDHVKRLIKPGYRSLFYGPPGTGKTLTVSLLGKTTGKDVYKIDLSMVVSKYIGETEKNLSKVFDMAENKNWILFFDEADALFGKRTVTSSSNDRYANQEVAYLLQRIEDFPGLIILASNLKTNIDDAFSRRFQSMVHFPMPGAAERLQLWENAFRHHVQLANDVNLKQIADKYALSGGAIINVLMYTLLHSKKTQRHAEQAVILEGIKRELKKEGKTA